jgi:hypothetical protein
MECIYSALKKLAGERERVFTARQKLAGERVDI